MKALRASRNRLLVPYIGFVLLLFSSGAAAGTGYVQSQLASLVIILIICSIPVILLNISLHKHIRRVAPSAGSSGWRQAVVSSLLFTPLEAALVLPAINITIAGKVLKREVPPPNN
ncbi:MAG: hypothetical protein AAGF57_12180 [Pseudomonadota bacterium]